MKRVTFEHEKALRETQTLRAGCIRAEPEISPRRSPPPHRLTESVLAVVRYSKNFRPAADPLPVDA